MNTLETNVCKPTNFPANLTHTGHFDIEELWSAPRLVPDKCLNPSNQMFVQYTCEHDSSSMHSRYQAICFVAFTSLLTAFIFMIWTRKSLKDSLINFVNYDLDTIDVADYTVYMEIDQGKYKDWKDEDSPRQVQKGLSPALALKERLAEDLRKVLKSQRKEANVFNKIVQAGQNEHKNYQVANI